MRYWIFFLAFIVSSPAFSQVGLGGALLKGGGVDADNQASRTLPPQVH